MNAKDKYIKATRISQTARFYHHLKSTFHNEDECHFSLKNKFLDVNLAADPELLNWENFGVSKIS